MSVIAAVHFPTFRHQIYSRYNTEHIPVKRKMQQWFYIYCYYIQRMIISIVHNLQFRGYSRVLQPAVNSQYPLLCNQYPAVR